jgi:hypothetical protein
MLQQLELQSVPVSVQETGQLSQQTGFTLAELTQLQVTVYSSSLPRTQRTEQL